MESDESKDTPDTCHTWLYGSDHVEVSALGKTGKHFLLLEFHSILYIFLPLWINKS